VVDLITLDNMDKLTYSFPRRDPLTVWAERNTDPNGLFLGGQYVIHPILLAGRKVYYGWPYFAWSAGYDTSGREQVVRAIFSSDDPRRIKDLLKNNGIRYVIVDDGTRSSSTPMQNERIFQEYFHPVYQDSATRVTVYDAR